MHFLSFCFLWIPHQFLFAWIVHWSLIFVSVIHIVCTFVSCWEYCTTVQLVWVIPRAFGLKLYIVNKNWQHWVSEFSGLWRWCSWDFWLHPVTCCPSLHDHIVALKHRATNIHCWSTISWMTSYPEGGFSFPALGPPRQVSH